MYLIGESRTNLDNAITTSSIPLSRLCVDPETDQILQFGCTHTVDLTETFLSRLFVGQNLWERKETLEAELNRRYGGSSKKAIVVAYLDAIKRYPSLKEAARRHS
ncbi:MAG: DUF3870 domain-containing protein [Flavonifractor plautii]